MFVKQIDLSYHIICIFELRSCILVALDVSVANNVWLTMSHDFFWFVIWKHFLHFWPFVRGIHWTPGSWFNIKMSSYQYRKSHCGDKTVVRSSYLHSGISYTGKMTSLYWIRAQWIPFIKASDVEVWCFLCCQNGQAVEPTVKLLVIWDTTMLMWCHCNMTEVIWWLRQWVKIMDKSIHEWQVNY